MRYKEMIIVAFLTLMVLTGSAWADITVDVKVDGIYQKDKIYIGASGTHPTTIPFSLSDSSSTRGNNGYVISKEEGCYIWSDANGWHVRFNGDHTTHIFRGTITSSEIVSVQQYAWDMGDDYVVDIDDENEDETENFFDATTNSNRIQFVSGVNPHEDGFDITVSSSMGDTSLTAPQMRHCGATKNSLIPNWTNAFETANNIKSYNVYRSTSSGSGYTLLHTITRVGRQRYVYNDTSITAGTRYYYRVTAVDESGEESNKSVACTGKLLSSPTLIAPIGDIDSLPTMTFTPVDGTVRYAIRVKRATGLFNIWAVGGKDENQSQLEYEYNFNGTALQELQPGVTYKWRVFVYDGFGNVGVSDFAEFTYNGSSATSSGGDAFIKAVDANHARNENRSVLELAAFCGNPAKVLTVTCETPGGVSHELSRVGSTRLYKALVNDVQYEGGEYKFHMTTTSGKTMTMVDNFGSSSLNRPEVYNPLPESTNNLPMEFKWNTISGAYYYRLKIFRVTDRGAVGAVLANIPSDDPGLVIGNELLSSNTTYACRVQVISNPAQEGIDAVAISDTVIFTTGTTTTPVDPVDDPTDDPTDEPDDDDTFEPVTPDMPSDDDQVDDPVDPVDPVDEGPLGLRAFNNRFTYNRGENLNIFADARGDGTPVDVYVAIWTPNEEMVFVNFSLFGVELTTELVPVARSWESQSLTGPVFTLPIGEGYLSTSGQYTIYAVFVAPGEDVMDSANWLSTLSVSSFTIN